MTLANKLVAAITSLHVLAHSVFGCCGHDMHGGAKAAAEHRCHHSAPHESKAGVCQHRAEIVLISHDADLVASIPPLGEASTPQPAHECRHADCHWKTGEKCPDIELLEFYADATVVVVASVTHAHARFSGPAGDDDVGLNCALHLRLQFMSGVLQV